MNHKQRCILLILISSVSVIAKEPINDPTKPPISVIKAEGNKTITHFKLTEIRINNNERIAVINGRRLKRGSMIAGYRVKNIETGHVTLSNNKGSLKLNLVNSRIIRKKL